MVNVLDALLSDPEYELYTEVRQHSWVLSQVMSADAHCGKLCGNALNGKHTSVEL